MATLEVSEVLEPGGKLLEIASKALERLAKALEPVSKAGEKRHKPVKSLVSEGEGFTQTSEGVSKGHAQNVQPERRRGSLLPRLARYLFRGGLVPAAHDDEKAGGSPPPNEMGQRHMTYWTTRRIIS